MPRKEFSTKTRKEALKRSGGICEAVGAWYGLPALERCTNALSHGVEYDHYILDANSHDNSLENCKAVCSKCHGWKTRNRDIPLAAKTVAQAGMGLKLRAKVKISSPPTAPKPARDRLPALPPRALFSKLATWSEPK